MEEAQLYKARRLIRRGNFRLNSGEYEAAFQAYEKCLEYFPESIELLGSLAAISLIMGKVGNAIRFYRDSLIIEDNVETRKALAFALLKNKEFEESIEIFEGLNGDKIDNEISGGLGIGYLQLKQNLTHARNLLKFSVDKGNNEFEPFLGLVYHELNQHSEALGIFRSGMDKWDSIHALAVQYLKMGSIDMAHRYFNQALELYQKGEIIEEKVINQLKFDLVLSLPHSQDKIVSLKNYETDNSLNVYIAILSTLQNLEDNDDLIKEYIEKILAISDDEEFNSSLTEWKDHLEVSN
ncbi:MAG: hypothetical protein OEZ01_05075 [Candidatus Heimdallarchaeota archaeon]|nr:hypothetical protein [Candidatus Heimdallarchaeota archaeon]MDH5645355.1 hypothetical protein [Candidatus Heimdallarchaeota archaeon]